MRNLSVKLRILYLNGVRVVNAIHFRRFKNDLRPDLIRAQGGRRVGGEIRIAGACSENHDASLFKMANSAAPNEHLGNFLHLDRGLDAGENVHLLESILK